jgi:small-conductance mechanosensitive channel
VVLILSVTIVLSKLSTGFVKLYTGRVLPSTSIFVNLTKVFVFVLGMLVLLQTIGISVAPIITALGVGGLAVALALQDTLSNLFAGLHIIASKKIKPGDYIKVDIGAEGFLEDITWRNTSIRTPQNNTVILPNNKMASAVITNYNIPSKELDVTLQLSVSYDSDLAKVEKTTKEVAKEVLSQCCPGQVVQEPSVRFDSFAPSSISFTIIMRAREIADGGIIKHEFIKKLMNRYKQEGIKIPFPTTSVYLENNPK